MAWTSLIRQMWGVLAIFLTAVCTSTVAFADNPRVPEGFESCSVLSDDQARLHCFKRLLPAASPSAPTAQDTMPQEAWRLLKTPDPRGGPVAVAIMRTANTAKSDPELAGLMIRCQDHQGLGVLLGLVRPLPPRSKRNVAIGAGSQQSVLVAESSQAGTALTLPIDATVFTKGPWQGLQELEIKIHDPEGDIHGVIPLDGVAPALAKLAANCPTN